VDKFLRAAITANEGFKVEGANCYNLYRCQQLISVSRWRT